MSDESTTYLTTEQPQVIYREGKAPDVPSEKSVDISGTLKAPGDYLLHKTEQSKVERIKHSNQGYKTEKEQMYHADQSTLYVSREDKKIEVCLNEKNFTTDTVRGILKKAKIWDELKVNEDHSWSIEGLRKQMKRIRFYFADPAQHAEFMLKLQKFVAKVDKEIKDTNASGEFEKSVSNTLVNGGLIPEFKIKAPVYKGYDKKVVRVEVLADVSDGSVRFQLESQDLFTLEEELAEKYINEEVGRIKKLLDDKISVVNLN